MPDTSAQHPSLSDDDDDDGDDDDNDFDFDTYAEDAAQYAETMSEPGDDRAIMVLPQNKRELIAGRCKSCSPLVYGISGDSCSECKSRKQSDRVCAACWLDLPRNPKLCDSCQRWNTGKHSCFIDQAYSQQSMHEMLGNKNCILCRPLTIAVLEKIRARWSGRKLTSFEVKSAGPVYKDRRAYETASDVLQTIAPVAEVGGKRKIRCKFSLSLYIDGKPETEERILIPLKLYYRTALGGLWSVKPWRSANIDVRSLRRAIGICEAHHSEKCQPELPPLPDGVRLIDTQYFCLVRPDPTSVISFVALSYACAATSQEFCRKLSHFDPLSFEEPGALRRQDYPSLIWDAMTLCTDMGERYLWVDCLCIIQDDDVEMLRQIQTMDRIYSCARFTIVVTADYARDLGIPGVRTRLRSTWWEEDLSGGSLRLLDFNFLSDITNSKWNSRGWTYQEQCLSRRKVFISNHRSFFTCQEMDFQENRGRRIPDSDKMDVHECPPTIWLKSWKAYMSSVENYTARNLISDTDILRAFDGYSRVAAKQLETRIFFGMPERYISRALLFEPGDLSKRREGTEDIPSWSWAAWRGMADFDAANRYLDRDGHGCLVIFHYVDPEDGLVELWDEDRWFWDEDFPEDDQPCDWAIEARDSSLSWPTRPSYDWRDCPHNRTEVENHLELDEDMEILAATHPSSLVFNTTIAKLFLESNITGVIRTPDITIRNESGQLVGIVNKDINLPVPDWVDTSNQYEIIVIGAGVLATGIREPTLVKDQLPARLRGLWLESPTGEQRTPWVLSVMVVKRRGKERNIVERLGTGFVLMEFWRLCEPTWETIVLV